MLDANDPAFQQQYPNGATVYDRTGRRIANVIACNPETGEVITFDSSQLTRACGFWPAPLTIEPCQWLHIGIVNHFAPLCQPLPPSRRPPSRQLPYRLAERPPIHRGIQRRRGRDTALAIGEQIPLAGRWSRQRPL